MTDDNKSTSSDQRALIKFLLENRAMVNWISILMIVYAVWATIEVLTNASGATWWPPETGTPVSDYFESDTSSQNINNGWVIGLGAVFGTLGVMVQYFYRAAPYVDASMQATAALIISAVKEEEIQESAERLAVEMVAEAEEAEAAAEAEAKAEAEAEAAAKAEANTVEQADTSAAETVASDEDLLEDGQRKKF
jgi:hypothetical protein